MSGLQVIYDDAGQPVFAVLPWREYQGLTGQQNDGARLSDEELYDLAKSEAGESFPLELAERILDGENPISVYRNHRGMTQQELAAAAGINEVYLSQIEIGKRIGSAGILASLAAALNVTADDLTPLHNDPLHNDD